MSCGSLVQQARKPAGLVQIVDLLEDELGHRFNMKFGVVKLRKTALKFRIYSKFSGSY